MDGLSVTSKGQVTIPKGVRQKLGIRAGSRVVFRLIGDRAELEVLRPPTTVVSGSGMLVNRGAAVPADFDVASLLKPGAV